MSKRSVRGSYPPRRQRGAAVLLITGALVALLAIAGLALDGGHMMLNKTRLQNAVDAATLAAAKAVDETGDTDIATAAALTVFGRNASAAGNRELDTSYAGGSGNLQLTVEYSETLLPFVPGAPAGPYVRVTATNMVLPTWLMHLVSAAEKRVGASAVAGPSPTIDRPVCNIAPMMVCGAPEQPGDGDSSWGYELNAPAVLKTSAGGGWDSTPGPGNFLLVRLDGGQGANALRTALAGSYNVCVEEEEDTIGTEPGNTVGPVAQGLNTRFGQYAGPMQGMEAQYPPDVIVTAQSPPLSANDDDVYQGPTRITAENVDQLYSYQDYAADVADPVNYDFTPLSDGGIGAFERRVLAVPFGDCSGATGGQGEVPLLGFGCFFLLQPVSQQGNEAHVFGQFVGQCAVTGAPGPNPNSGPGPYIIQLYKNPDSTDS